MVTGSLIPLRNDEMTRGDLLVRNSERSQWNKCRWAWMLNYHFLYTPRSRKHYFEFGDLIHRALADYYIPETRRKRKRGPHPARTFLKLYDVLEAKGKDFGFKIDGNEEEWVSARELGEEMLVNYIDFYGKDEAIVVIYPEMPFTVDIHHPTSGRFVGRHSGVGDAFIFHEDQGKFGLFEHKTARSIDTSHLFIDEQASTYWTLLPIWLQEQEILEGPDSLGFMLYNYLRKGKRDVREQNALGQYLNLDGTVSKKQPPKLFHREIVRRGKHDRAQTHGRIIEQMDEIFKAHNGRMKIYKQPSKDCSFCQFKDVCELHEIGSDWEELLDLAYQQWDPYEQHVASIEIQTP